jgi:tetratricopeptide (TPR) repeat protein
MLGRARASLGQAAEGVALIGAALFRPGEPRVHGSKTLYLTWLAEAHAMAGDPAQARAVLEDALALNPRELYFRPETLRIRGDLSRSERRLDAAEADYRAALALARSIGANTFVQRSLSSLAGLQQSRGHAHTSPGGRRRGPRA